MTYNNLLGRFSTTIPFRSLTLLLLAITVLSACDDEAAESYERTPELGYQHDISLNQAFISTADVRRSITIVGDRYHGEREGDVTLRFDIVDDPAEANVLFTCVNFKFDEELAREIDAAERAAGAKGNTFRLPVLDNGGNLRITALPDGPNLNELMNVRGATENQAFRRVHFGFWQEADQADLLRNRSSEMIFESSAPGATVQDALNSAYGLLDMFIANSDTLYARLYQESELETDPATTVEIRD